MEYLRTPAMLREIKARTLISKFGVGSIRANSDIMHKLLAIGPPAVKPLISALSSLDDQIVLESVRTLGHLGDPRALPALEKVLDHEDEDVRKRALVAIKRIQTSDQAKSKSLLIHELKELRKRSKAEILKSERRYRLLADNISDVIWTLDLNMNVLYASPSVKRLIGFTSEEIMKKGQPVRFAPASEELARKTLAKELALVRSGNRNPDREMVLELEFLRKDGSTVWAEVRANFLYDEEGQPTGIVGVTRDITDRKKAEAKLQRYEERLRSLASEQTLSEERQRRNIAVQLNENTSQKLAFVITQLKILREKIQKAGFAEDLDEIIAETENTIKETRYLIFTLSPPSLYKFGLQEALEELFESYQKKWGIRSTFSSVGQSETLSENLRVLIFNIVKELLFNVVRHSGASEVKGVLRRDGKNAILTVSDNGVGFDPSELEDSKGDSGGFGLFSIRERVQNKGGDVDIVSSKGQGTQITLRFPIFKDKDEILAS